MSKLILIAVCLFTALGAFSQTNPIVPPPPTSIIPSPYGDIGFQTYAAAPPVVDRFSEVLSRLETILNGALIVITALLGWYANNSRKIAAITPLLIKSIETHGTIELKGAIKQTAEATGVEPVLAALVESNTSHFKKPTVTIDAFKPAQEKKTT